MSAHSRLPGFAIVSVCAVLLLIAQVASAQLSITNNSLIVNYNTGTAQFSVVDIASQRTFISSGTFNSAGGSAILTTATNATFGSGPAIRIAHADGSSDAIMLFSNVPFALFQSTLYNGSAQTVVSNKIHALTALVDMNQSVGSLAALGTGGLTTPAGNPGSYSWLAVADPQSRNGVVGAWLTTDRGSGIVFGKVNGSLVQMDAQVDYGRLQFLPGQTNVLELFGLGYFSDARAGLETWAAEVAQIYQIHLNPQPDGYCTYPSSPNGGASNPNAVAQLGDFAKTNLVPFGFSMLQIDAGWQAGINTTNPYTGSSIGKREFFAVDPNGSYAVGMTPTSTHLAGDGLTSGLWFTPFGSSASDPYFTNHTDWFIKTTNGTPYWVNFGGACLDATYAPARDYVSNFVYQIANVWNYKYFKMDGLWSGSGTPLKYVNSGYVDDSMGDAVFSDPSKPNIEVFRDGLKLVRQAAGTNVFLDGCNIAQNMRSYSGSFGLLDGIRIGPDNGATWGSASGSGSGWLRSPLFGSRHYFLHGRIWYNDPDTVYVRSSFTTAQAQTMASWFGISGQLTLDGDWIPGLAADRVDMLKRIMPHHPLLPRPVDYFENDPPRMWLLTDTRRTPRRDVIGVFNWSTNTSQSYNVSLSHIGLPGTNYVGYNFWSNSLIPAITSNLQLTLPPGACGIIAVRPATNFPQVISTSRHVTQGIVDILAENWDGTNVLSGTSLIVGGDPYELRIVSPSAGWKVQSAAVSAADQAAGVTVSFTQSNGLARVTLLCATNRQVSWSASFGQVPVATLTSPVNGAVYYTNDVIPLAATANSPTGSIVRVDFYQNAAKVGTATSAPYTAAISNQPPGTYNFSAVATDNGGISVTSAVAQVQVQVFVPFVISVSPPSQTIFPGQGTNFTVTITTTNNFTNTIALTVSGAPAGATATLNPVSISGAGSSTLTVTTLVSVVAANYPLTITGVSVGLTNSATATLIVSGAANLRWNGTSSGAWDATSANWYNLNSGTSDLFANGDSVLIDDTSGLMNTLTIGSTVAVAPSVLTEDADVYDYTISGAGKITGTGGIVKSGAAMLTLSTANDFTGPVTVTGGVLKPGNVSALGSGVGSTTVSSGGTLDVGGISLVSEPMILSDAGVNGGGAVINSGAQQTSALRTVTLAGDVTLGGSGRWDIRNTGGTASLSTSPANSAYKITKVGANQVSLVGVTSIDPALGDIDIQQGEFAVQTTTVQVGDPNKTITVHSNAVLEVWNLTAGPLNKRIVLQDGATVFNENGTSVNAGPVTLQGSNTFNIAGTQLTFTNVLSGLGSLYKTGGGVLVLNVVNTFSGATFVTSGTLTLSGAGSMAASSNLVVATGATLNASARTDGTLTLTAGQVLAGNGNVTGNLIAPVGSTVAPGSSVGVLTVSGTATLRGTTAMELNRTASTNDVLVAGAITYAGTLSLTNLAGTVQAGDSFKLFNATNYAGAFTNIVPAIPALNLAWNTNGLTNGMIAIVSAPTARPTLRVTRAGNSLVFAGSNGVPGWNYYLLSATNLSVPLSNWTRLATNVFDGSGAFMITNGPGTNAQRFYLLQLP
jgi:autotransporter-associated beta strand protein